MTTVAVRSVLERCTSIQVTTLWRVHGVLWAMSPEILTCAGMRGTLVTLLKHRPGNRRRSAVRGN